MFAALNAFLTGGASEAKDPYWANVSMLLHGDGTNAAQNNTFLDGSTNNFTVTRNGNTTQGSFNPFVSTYPYSVATNGGSGYFDGTGDYLTVPDNAAFTLGTNDFTIECWINSDSVASQRTITAQENAVATLYSYYMAVRPGGLFSCSILDAIGTTPYTIFSGAGAILANTWYHVAFVRNGNTCRQYINGVQAGTVNVTGVTVYDSADVLGIGCLGAYTVAQTFNGYISNFRLVNGTCLYPSGTTFTPPTAPLTAVTNTALLLGMSNAAIFDNAILNNLETVANAQISTSVFKYGTGSMKFNGTTDYLPTPAKTAFNVGAGDFTVECWIYPTVAQNAYVVGQTDASFTAANTSLYVYITSLRIPRITVYVGGSFYDAISSTAVTLNTWTHIAAVRDGATLRIYVNGVQTGTVSVTTLTVNTSTASVSVGRAGDYAGQYFPGYIDDFRFTKGICRYPSGTAFTPPTAAFPNS
jgi:hypothetical protein